MRRALEINVNTPTNDAEKINVSFVSNTATEQQLYQFATSLVDLTTNTFVSVNLITTEELAGE